MKKLSVTATSLFAAATLICAQTTYALNSSSVISPRKTFSKHEEKKEESKKPSPYQSHLNNRSEHRYENKAESSEMKNAQIKPARYESRVLQSKDHGITQMREDKPTHLSIRSQYPKDVSHIVRDQPLKVSDYEFLSKLQGSIANPLHSRKLAAIMMNQRENKKLTNAEYVFLVNMAKQIDDNTVSYKLYEIAEKRRP